MRIACLFTHTGCNFIIQAKVEDGIHHARHRCTCTGTNRYKERILGIAELAVHQSLGMCNRCIDVVLKQFYDFILTYLVIFVTGIRRDSETWRYGNTDMVHFCKVCTFSAQYLTHLSISFGLSVAEGVYTFLTHNVFLVKLL